MAIVKLTQSTTTTHIAMRKISIGRHQSVKSFFDRDDFTSALMSYEDGVDLEKNDYWNLYDERDSRRYIVEFPKGTFKGNVQTTTKKLLGEYVEWSRLIFGEWTNKFKGRVIEVVSEGFTQYAGVNPLANKDRLYYCSGSETGRIYRVVAIKKHKRYASTN